MDEMKAEALDLKNDNSNAILHGFEEKQKLLEILT